ncbi:MAG: hypothetical protein AAF242_04535 [Bacteroidota bacterium]
MSTPLPKVDMARYLAQPDRYELRAGTEEGAPLCPYGNHYAWIGYDLEAQIYVRFTKSVFKLLIQQKNVD